MQDSNVESEVQQFFKILTPEYVPAKTNQVTVQPISSLRFASARALDKLFQSGGTGLKNAGPLEREEHSDTFDVLRQLDKKLASANFSSSLIELSHLALDVSLGNFEQSYVSVVLCSDNTYKYYLQAVEDSTINSSNQSRGAIVPSKALYLKHIWITRYNIESTELIKFTNSDTTDEEKSVAAFKFAFDAPKRVDDSLSEEEQTKAIELFIRGFHYAVVDALPTETKYLFRDLIIIPIRHYRDDSGNNMISLIPGGALFAFGHFTVEFDDLEGPNLDRLFELVTEFSVIARAELYRLATDGEKYKGRVQKDKYMQLRGSALHEIKNAISSIGARISTREYEMAQTLCDDLHEVTNTLFSMGQEQNLSSPDITQLERVISCAIAMCEVTARDREDEFLKMQFGSIDAAVDQLKRAPTFQYIPGCHISSFTNQSDKLMYIILNNLIYDAWRYCGTYWDENNNVYMSPKSARISIEIDKMDGVIIINTGASVPRVTILNSFQEIDGFPTGFVTPGSHFAVPNPVIDGLQMDILRGSNLSQQIATEIGYAICLPDDDGSAFTAELTIKCGPMEKVR